MPEEAPTRTRAELGAALHGVRTLHGIGQRELAERLGVSQSLVSRVERGTRLLDRPAVIAWLKAVKAGREVRDRVLALTEAAHSETRTWTDLLGGEKGHLQDESQARNVGAALVQNWQPSVLPGLLQTADYARLVIALTDPDDEIDRDAALAARVTYQGVLREPGRRFDFVIPERLLRWEPGPGVLAPQLAHLTAVAVQLDSVNLAVLPEGHNGMAPWHNFIIRAPDDGSAPYVNAELVHGEATITDPESVAVYRRAWDRLWAAALTGDEAVQMIRQASATIWLSSSTSRPAGQQEPGHAT